MSKRFFVTWTCSWCDAESTEPVEVDGCGMPRAPSWPDGWSLNSGGDHTCAKCNEAVQVIMSEANERIARLREQIKARAREATP